MTTVEGGVTSPAAASDLSSALRSVWRHRRLMGGLTTLFAAAAAVIALCKPPIYSASVTLLPHNQISLDGTLGTLFDVTGVMGSGLDLEPYYSDIVVSDRVLDEVIARNWGGREGQEPRTLFEILRIRNGTQDMRVDRIARDKLKRKLRGDVIRFGSDRASGVMRLTCSFPRYPDLAADLANFLVDRLGAYAVQNRRTKAGEQRQFVAGRLEEVRAELDSATAELARFVQGNRLYAQSPVLQERYGQLVREVEAKTAIWTELRRQLEIARIDEEKSIVTLTILDYATPPVKKSGPFVSLYFAVGLLLGLIVSFLVVLTLEFRGALAQSPPATAAPLPGANE